jgi:hypothetical protein
LDQLNQMEEIVRRRQHEEQVKKEEEARLTIGLVNPGLQPFPVPDWSAAQKQQDSASGQKAIPIEFEQLNSDPALKARLENGVGGPRSPEEERENPERPFKKVAPPPELNLDNYGYSSRHPDYKIAEYMAQKEYEQLENKGYPEEIKDKEGDKVSRKRKSPEEDGPIYIVQPKSATMYLSTPAAPFVSSVPSVPGASGKSPEVITLEVRSCSLILIVHPVVS